MLRRIMGSPRTTRLVILDFDGTFTDAYAEAGPFVEGFKRDLFDLLGRDASEEWDRLEAEVTAHPEKYGWMNGSHIAAPAGADPYTPAPREAAAKERPPRQFSAASHAGGGRRASTEQATSPRSRRELP